MSLWKLRMHTRIKMLIWKLVWRVLPTCEALNDRFHITFTNYSLCELEKETHGKMCFLCAHHN
jgi:hypothetical protein